MVAACKNLKKSRLRNTLSRRVWLSHEASIAFERRGSIYELSRRDISQRVRLMDNTFSGGEI